MSQGRRINPQHPSDTRSRRNDDIPRYYDSFHHTFTHSKLQQNVHSPNVHERVYNKNWEDHRAELRQQLSRETAKKLYKSNAGVKRPTVYGGGGDEGEPQFDLRQQLSRKDVRPREVVYSGDEDDEDIIQFHQPRAKRRHTNHNHDPNAYEHRGVSSGL